MSLCHWAITPKPWSWSYSAPYLIPSSSESTNRACLDSRSILPLDTRRSKPLAIPLIGGPLRPLKERRGRPVHASISYLRFHPRRDDVQNPVSPLHARRPPIPPVHLARHSPGRGRPLSLPCDRRGPPGEAIRRSQGPGPYLHEPLLPT